VNRREAPATAGVSISRRFVPLHSTVGPFCGQTKCRKQQNGKTPI
jgi:hypothetical protein